MRQAVIIDYVRTPFGRYAGALSGVRPDDLAATVVAEAVRRIEADPAGVDEVLLGATNQAGEDNRNVARMATLLAGFPVEVPAATVNRLCASGLEAVSQAARAVRCHEGDLILAGGVESMSRAPMVTAKPERGFPRGGMELQDTTIGWRFVNPRMEQLHGTDSMGETAENVADRYDVSRDDQDAFALESHRRAVAAAKAGFFDGELVAVEDVEADEGPRADSSIERLGKLRAIFREGGSVSAGNSSPINDGAACVVVASEERARQMGAEPLARVVATGAAGVDPAYMGVGPIPATRLALERAGLSLDDIDLVELNEAFASQAAGLPARARDRPRQAERERRRDRDRPPTRRLRRALDRHARARAAPPRRPLWRRHDVHRRGPGHGNGDREPGGMIDFELTDEQKLIRDTAREFADNEIAPRARENDRAEKYDAELTAKMAELGFIGPILPEEYGGRGIDYRTYGLIVEEIGRVDSSARTVISVCTSLFGSAIARWGDEEQKQRIIPGLTDGTGLGCFGLTEPDSGSDAASLKTRAEKTDGGWKLTGQKQWISLGNVARWALIFAQTDPSKAHKGLAAFVVPTDADGFSSSEIHGKLGLKASDTAELALDGVEVGDDALLGEVGDGFKVAMTSLDSGRFSVASGCVGICQGCLDASVAYAKERTQFDRPLAAFQLVQALIADMVLDTEAGRSLVWKAGWLKDQGKPNTLETSTAKLFATEAAIRTANNAIQVHGGSGYVDDYPVERHLRDARVATLYEGTSQIQKLIIGRAMTGVNAMS